MAEGSSSFVVRFQLLATQRREPRSFAAFTGYLLGQCIVRVCAAHPELVGRQMSVELKSAASCSSMLVYEARTARMRKGGGIQVPATEYVRACGVDEYVTTTTAQEMTGELKTRKGTKRAIQVLREAFKNATKLSTMRLFFDEEGAARFNVLREAGRDTLHAMRIQFIQQCVGAGLAYEEVNVLAWEHLQSVTELVRERPWVCVFYAPMKTTYKCTPLTERQYEVLVGGVRVPAHVRAALAVYFQAQRTDDTLFSLGDYECHLRAHCVDETERGRALEFLEHYTLRWVDKDALLFTWNHHWRFAQLALDALDALLDRARTRAPECRPEDACVPVRPLPLTLAQRAIAAHVRTHAVTIVEGFPGTGKTVLVTDTVATFSRVLCCSLTGMMVQEIQRRCGNHPEVAFTIHSILQYRKCGGDAAAQWLDAVDTLIVDEFSNVPARLFAKLLCAVPNVVRLVLVGDHNQIRPIEPGDPMADMTQCFGVCALTDILRVEPHLSALYMAPKLMVEENAELEFNDDGPLSFVPVTQDVNRQQAAMCAIVNEIVARDRDLMHHHVVCLKNATRRMLNTFIENTLCNLGVLKKPPTVTRVGYGVPIYEGCKITFTQNYKRMCELDETTRGEPVCNGELAVVLWVRTTARATVVGVTDGFRRKTVVLSKQVADAVDPAHVEMGYVTTTTKVQGKEFARVVFWNTVDPVDFWTRSHAYVAISRGKERVWVVGPPGYLERMCRNVDRERRTVMGHLLETRALVDHALPASVGVRDFQNVPLMSPQTPCTVVLQKDDEDEDDEAPRKRARKRSAK
jgi:AAA domain